MDWLPSIPAWTRDRTSNLGMCPDCESDLQLFSYRPTLQPTEMYRLGLNLFFEENMENMLNVTKF